MVIVRCGPGGSYSMRRLENNQADIALPLPAIVAIGLLLLPGRGLFRQPMLSNSRR
jgi:hypothetical protein